MKLVKCPNCQNILTLDESKEYIDCEQCNSSFINPYYNDEVYVPEEVYDDDIEEYSNVNKVEKANNPNKEVVKKDPKPINKKALFISIICIASAILIATIIMGSVALANFAPQLKFDSIVKKLDDPVDVEYEMYSYYDSESKVFVLAYLEAEYKGGEQELEVYCFESASDAKDFFAVYKEFLSYDEEIQRSGKYVYIGTNLDDVL